MKKSHLALAFILAIANSASSRAPAKIDPALKEFFRLRGIPFENPPLNALAKTSDSPPSAPLADPNWSSPFNSRGPSGIVRTLHANGASILAAGEFNGADGRLAEKIAKWDGAQWVSPGSPFRTDLGEILSIINDGDSIYCSGRFESIGGIASKNVAMWDGKIWKPMTLQSGSQVTTLSFWNGKLLAATDSGVFRWNGTNWNAFGSKFKSSRYTWGTISRLTMINDQLWLAGDFVMRGDSSIQNLAIWNGSDWATATSSPIGRIRDFAVFKNNLFVVENHSTQNLTDSQAVKRWTGLGWEQLTVNPATSFIQAIECGPDDMFLIGMAGLAYMGGGLDPFLSNRFTEMWIDKWSGVAFQSLERKEFGGWIFDAAISGKRLCLGGRFSGIAGIRADNLACFEGGVWKSVSAAVDPGPSIMANMMKSDGASLYFGGPGMWFGGASPAGGLLRWNSGSWENFGGGFRERAVPSIRSKEHKIWGTEVSVVRFKGSDIYAGGSFDSSQAGSMMNIARWDGSKWHPLGGGFPGMVNDILVQGSDLIVGGWDRDSVLVPSHPLQGQSVARWDGQAWHKLGEGLSGQVDRVFHYRNRLYAFGQCWKTGQVTRNNMFVWNSIAGFWGRVEVADLSGMKGTARITDVALFKGELYLLGPGLIRFDTSGLFHWIAPHSTEDGNLAVDENNLYILSSLTLPDKTTSQLTKWDGTNLAPILPQNTDPGFQEFLNRGALNKSIEVHGDYLYLSGLLWPANGKDHHFYARWNRETGTWSAPFSKRDSKWGPILIFDAKGMPSLDHQRLQSDVYGLDGRKKVKKHLSAGVSVIQRGKTAK